MQIPRDEFLMITSYEDIVNELLLEKESWTYVPIEHSDRPKIIYCPLEHIYELFETFRKRKKNMPETMNDVKVVLVSANSDYGIHEQSIDHPNFDLPKMVARQDFSKVRQLPTDVYGKVEVGPVCDLNRCKPSDKYSIKMDTWTISTFPEVPDNVVAWYTTNLNVNHPKIKPLAFGLNWQGDGTDILENMIKIMSGWDAAAKKRNTRKLIYANFQNYCQRRLDLKRFLGEHRFSSVTFDKYANLPIEDFLDQLIRHVFVLCPPGNGISTYRDMEATYLGAIPVFEQSAWANHISKILPCCLIVESFEEFCSLSKEKILEGLNYCVGSDNYNMVTRSYWKNEFEKCLAM